MTGRTLLTAAAALGAAAAGLGAHAAAAAMPRTSLVAQARGSAIAVYRSPNAAKAFLRLSNPGPDGTPRVFLVSQRAPGWERVYLPVRPNGSSGWVRDADVDLSVDPYRVVVVRATRTVSIYKGGGLVRRIRAAVGRAVMPTPTGTYFLVELLRQPDPNGMLGPYVFTLSAFSNVLFNFGGGPGQIGLHGTNTPSLLGNDVSHGCIRVSNADITALARILPLGTPVEIH
jgi:lipoprotein-anchoring transpeptidase ErfK/SrfK